MQQKTDTYLKNKKYAANFLGVSQANLDRFTKYGMIGQSGERVFLKSVKLGLLVRFRPEELAAFAEACTRKPVGGAAA